MRPRAPPLLQWSNSTSYATEMLKTVDHAAERRVSTAQLESVDGAAWHADSTETLTIGDGAAKPSASQMLGGATLAVEDASMPSNVTLVAKASVAVAALKVSSLREGIRRVPWGLRALLGMRV